MTTKERLHKLVDELSEDEAERMLRAAEPGRQIDDWGDLDAWSDAASRDSMRMLDEEEAAAGFSWKQRDS